MEGLNNNSLDLVELFTIRNFIIYLIIINIITFLAMWIDKIRAKRGKWRIKESTLFLLVAMGGGIGGIAGIYVFRHKTKKGYFTFGFSAIVIIEIIMIIWYML